MIKKTKRQRPAGELRQSQVLTTFGPGAMVDLPNHAVLIGGLEHWHGDRQRIYEDRLAERVRDLLDLEEVALYTPPVESEDPAAPLTGMTAFVFPTWFLGQVDEPYTSPDGREYRTRPLIPWNRLIKGGYQAENRKIHPVVPVRFVQACTKGHISDVDWYAFVREDFNTDRVGQLWLDEGGAGNDFAEVYVRCQKTKRRRPLGEAMVKGSRLLGTCHGRQPWLGPKVWEPCDEPNRLLIRSASTAYYSQTLSVISIPDNDAKLREAVNLVYEEFLQYAEDAGDVRRERKKQRVFNALEGFSDETVWLEVKRRNDKTPTASKGIKQAEIETLLSVPEKTQGDDLFLTEARGLTHLPGWLRSSVERIVLVHKLREVVAQVGFTRFEAAMPDVDGELSLGVQLAPLARETSWVPSVENRGEGVFIAFTEASVAEWLERDAVQERGRRLEAGFDAWKKRKQVQDDKVTFPGLPYVMLQSLSHLLITTLSLECGYAASAVRERVYAGTSGYGILLYTAAMGSEGTLGGLVNVGRAIETHLRQALDYGRLCSNDPVCAQHDPANLQEERFLHGAACHGCLLIAETCCERRNELLDRALVVPTVATRDAAFFPDAVFQGTIA